MSPRDEPAPSRAAHGLFSARRIYGIRKPSDSRQPNLFAEATLHGVGPAHFPRNASARAIKPLTVELMAAGLKRDCMGRDDQTEHLEEQVLKLGIAR